eukprot:gene3608-2548_t
MFLLRYRKNFPNKFPNQWTYGCAFVWSPIGPLTSQPNATRDAKTKGQFHFPTDEARGTISPNPGMQKKKLKSYQEAEANIKTNRRRTPRTIVSDRLACDRYWDRYPTRPFFTTLCLPIGFGSPPPLFPTSPLRDGAKRGLRLAHAALCCPWFGNHPRGQCPFPPPTRTQEAGTARPHPPPAAHPRQKAESAGGTPGSPHCQPITGPKIIYPTQLANYNYRNSNNHCILLLCVTELFNNNNNNNNNNSNNNNKHYNSFKLFFLLQFFYSLLIVVDDFCTVLLLLLSPKFLFIKKTIVYITLLICDTFLIATVAQIIFSSKKNQKNFHWLFT